MPERNEIPDLRHRLPAFADRIWNPANAAGYGHFTTRADGTDTALDCLLAERVPPGAPANLGASVNLYGDKVRIAWQSGGNYPLKFALYRNTTNDPTTAVLLSDTLAKSTTLYEDRKVNAGQDYYYWVKAWNKWGWSPLSASAMGRLGDGNNAGEAHEPFDYTAGAAIDGLAGGEGFNGAWNHFSTNGTVTIDAAGLSYPGISSTGGALRVTCTNNNTVGLSRTFAGSTGRDLEEVWMSFLVKAEKVGDGHVFLGMNASGSVGKAWANGFGLGEASKQMLPGQTYFAVAKYDCRNGNDKMYFWLNPDPAKEPSIEEADSVWEQWDLGIGNKIEFNIQGHGFGVYVFDEIRVGTSWKSAVETPSP